MCYNNTLQQIFTNLKINNKMKTNKFKTILQILTLAITVAFTINTATAQLHVVKPDGDVGIGTSTPTAKLDVNGNISATGNIGAKGGYVSIKPNSANERGRCSIALFGLNNGVASAEFVSNGLSRESTITTTSFNHYGDGVFNLRTYDSKADISFATKPDGDVPVWAINPAFTAKGGTGFVGINQRNPTAQFEVNGDAKKPGGGEWSTTSDKRTKKNINQYEAGLADVLKLNPVTFNYNGKAGITDTEQNHVGLIAQEFAKIAPYAVDKFNYTEEGSNKTEEYMSLDASSVKYMLVNAVKEQQAIIEAQTAKINSLEEKMEKIATNGAAISTPGATEISVLLEGTGAEKALLAQNTPNPFTTKTRIEYFIPADSRNARMSFRDMAGKEIKRVDLTHDGIGAIELSAKDLAVGIYSYVLYVDGSIVDSKKMVLRK